MFLSKYYIKQFWARPYIKLPYRPSKGVAASMTAIFDNLRSDNRMDAKWYCKNTNCRLIDTEKAPGGKEQLLVFPLVPGWLLHPLHLIVQLAPGSLAVQVCRAQPGRLPWIWLSFLFQLCEFSFSRCCVEL